MSCSRPNGQTQLLSAKKTRCHQQVLLGSITPCSPKGPSPQSDSTSSSATAKPQREQRNNRIGGFIDLNVIPSSINYAGPFHPGCPRKQTCYQQYCMPCRRTTGWRIIPSPLAWGENWCSARCRVPSSRTKYSDKLTMGAKSWLLINHGHYKLYPLSKSNIRQCCR